MEALSGNERYLDRLRAGDVELYGVLAERYRKRIYSAARCILRNDAEVEDAMQQAHLHALTHLNQFEGRSSFCTWLTRITINESLGRMRGRGRMEPLDTPVSPGISLGAILKSKIRDPEQQAFDNELNTALHSATGKLPVRLRKVFIAREVEHMSTAETAARLGISPECVKSRLFRAKGQLKEKLAKHIKKAA